MDRLTVAVDFDGTIAPSAYPALPEAPFPFVRERLQSYRDAGFQIIIYSVRTNPIHVDWWQQTQDLKRWLFEQHIPFDVISSDGKPPADVYIDDKAFAYDQLWGWHDVRLSPSRLLRSYNRDRQGYEAGKERRAADRRPDGSSWIALAGKMGSGKSTAATVLQGLYGGAIRGFSAGVKEKAVIQRGINPSLKTPAVRAVLQEIGHGERELDPDYWIKRYWDWATSLAEFPHVNLIVDDTRYLNEVEFLRGKGFRVGYVDVPERVRLVRLLRRDGEIPWGQLAHKSETELDGFSDWDFIIRNYTEADKAAAADWLERAAWQE